MKHNVFVLAYHTTSILNDEEVRDIKESGGRELSISDIDLSRNAPLGILVETIKKIWCCEPRVAIEMQQLFESDLHTPPRERWVLTFSRPA